MKTCLIIFLFVLINIFFTKSSFASEDITNKLIEVDIKKQRLYAWEGDKLVFETAISTGLIQTPTPTGTFSIYKKLKTRNMRGFSRVKGHYYLPKVPDVLYFKEGGYAIHGTYWHNNFGTRMSNGCINLPKDAAKWLYDWAPINTSLNIH